MGQALRRGARSCVTTRSVLACDFFVTVTAGLRILYVFVIMEVGTRRIILHWNVTDRPTAEWTAQQFRMIISGDEPRTRRLSLRGFWYVTSSTSLSFSLCSPEKTGALSDLFPLEHGISGERPGSI